MSILCKLSYYIAKIFCKNIFYVTSSPRFTLLGCDCALDGVNKLCGGCK